MNGPFQPDFRPRPPEPNREMSGYQERWSNGFGDGAAYDMQNERERRLRESSGAGSSQADRRVKIGCDKHPSGECHKIKSLKDSLYSNIFFSEENLENLAKLGAFRVHRLGSFFDSGGRSYKHSPFETWRIKEELEKQKKLRSEAYRRDGECSGHSKIQVRITELEKQLNIARALDSLSSSAKSSLEYFFGGEGKFKIEFDGEYGGYSEGSKIKTRSEILEEMLNDELVSACNGCYKDRMRKAMNESIRMSDAKNRDDLLKYLILGGIFFLIVYFNPKCSSFLPSGCSRNSSAEEISVFYESETKESFNRCDGIESLVEIASAYGLDD